MWEKPAPKTSKIAENIWEKPVPKENVWEKPVPKTPKNKKPAPKNKKQDNGMHDMQDFKKMLDFYNAYTAFNKSK